MLSTVFLSALLMLRGLRGAAVSDLQVFGKSSGSGKSLLSRDDGRHTVKRQPHQQIKNDARRSLDFESFIINSTPPTRKLSLPTIVKLYPPTPKPLHLHANMPLRFGRQSSPGDNQSSNTIPNMPQRFGRGWETIQMCAKCPGVRQAAKAAKTQGFGKTSLYWRLGTLASAQFLNPELYWTKNFDLTSSSEEVEIQDINL